MNYRTIRFQLTLWYAAALFLCLTVVLGLFYILTQQALFTQTDQTLISHGEPIVNLVSRAECCLTREQANNNQLLLQTLSNMPGMVVVLLSADGEILSSSSEVSSIQEHMQSLFQTYKVETKPVLINQMLHSTQMRFWVVPILQDAEFEGMILVGHPIDNIQQSLTSLLVTLGIVFALLIIPTLVGGYLLAQRAMQPIEAIDTQMEQISSTNLTQRVTNPQTGDEVERLSKTFNQLLDRLSTAFERERQLIGDLAHELKTPLAILRSTAELALTKKRSVENYQQVLSEVIVDADRLGHTLQQILDLAWSKAESTHFTAHECDLSAVVSELKEISSKLAMTKQIETYFSLDSHVKIMGKDDKLARAFLNIIENAIKYTPKKGKVRIKLTKEEDSVIFQVKDNGVGIAKADLPHIFDRFYRGTKTAKTLGSGLGLAITSAIVKAHNGKIGIKSTVDKGTTVTIRFPLIKIP